MLRYLVIANHLNGQVAFCHYFDPGVGSSLSLLRSAAHSEKDDVNKCLATGLKEGEIDRNAAEDGGDRTVVYRREGLLLVLIAGNETSRKAAWELLNAFLHILVQHFKITTERQVAHNTERIRAVLRQMVRPGGVLIETRISHITAILDTQSTESEMSQEF